MNSPQPVNAADGSTPATEPWLTTARVAQIAKRCAEWLIEPTSWIDRRKDTVRVLDDHSVRWQTSVDFGCRRDSDGIEGACDERPVEERNGETPKPNGTEERNGETPKPNGTEELYCAPLFVLPKQPSGYMAFDLTDETGRSLSLSGRADNARVTGEILVEMARRMLGTVDSDDAQEFEAMVTEIRKIATDRPREAKLHARWQLKLLQEDDAPPLWKRIAEHERFERFAWWLRTAAEASVVVVLFRSHPAARKRIKLSYQSSVLTTERSLRRRVGWEPYAILLDVPWVEARGYHLEAAAPPGLRIEHAWLNDDENDEGVQGGDFTRQVHLRRPEAITAGAGAGTLKLRVSGDGFLTGAWLAAFFVVAALLACVLTARAIAPNPAPAPALLLLLPGLLTSIVARPDRHALTTRLLSTARIVLIASGVVAYAAAVFVALAGASTSDKTTIDHRTATLRIALGAGFIVSAGLLAILSVAFVRGRPRLRGLFRRSDWRKRWRRWTRHRFELNEVIVLNPEDCLEKVYGASAAPLPRKDKDKELSQERIAALLPDARETPYVSGIMRRRWWSTWLLLLSAVPAEHGTLVNVSGHYLLPRFLAPFRGRRVAALEHQLLKRLDTLAKQCAQPERRALGEGAKS
jgi:hypothetical protein